MDQLTAAQKTLLEIGSIPLLVLLAALAGISLWSSRRRKAREQALQAREMAIMIEDVRATAAGNICMALLILTVLVSVAAFTAASSVFQQIEAGVVLMSGSILFGLGVALGRARSFRIYRSEHRDAQP